MEKKTSAKKYESKNGQYTGIRNHVEYVQSNEATSVNIIFFQKLNSVRLRKTGRSEVLIVKGISRLCRRYPLGD